MVQMLPFEQIIKPHQVANLHFLSSEQKKRSMEAISQLWQKIHEFPEPNNPERLAAHKRLSQVTGNLKQSLAKWRQENSQAGQPSAARLVTSQSQLDPSVAMAPKPNAPVIEFSQRVKNEANTLQIVVPGELMSRSHEEQQAWVTSQRQKYAMHLHRYEAAQRARQELSTNVQMRRQSGKPLSQEETQGAQTRLTQLNSVMAAAQRDAGQFKRRHEENARQQLLHQRQMSQQNNQPEMQNQVPQQLPKVPEQIKGEQVGDDVEAPEIQRQHSDQGEAPNDGSNRLKPGQGNQVPLSQPAARPTPSVPNQSTPKIEPVSRHSSPPAPPQPNSGNPRPLTHQDAMLRAQNNRTQAGQPTHGHPPQTHEQKYEREPIPAGSTLHKQSHPPRPLNVPPLAPSQLGPSRPTLSGGPGTMGSMGQPAIQKHPGYVLEGDGERVLSKKKLEELVRQVTGGGGEGFESLDPDVEEVSIRRSGTITWWHRRDPVD